MKKNGWTRIDKLQSERAVGSLWCNAALSQLSLVFSEKSAAHVISKVLIYYFMFDDIRKCVHQDFGAGQLYCSAEQKRAKASIECSVGWKTER